MSEFVIAASAVLVPLFLVIPFIGKIGDIKQAAIQTARYEAWEQTVWWDRVPRTDAVFGQSSRRIYPDNAAIPVRPRGVVDNEAERLFLYSGNSVADGNQLVTRPGGWESIYGDDASGTRITSRDNVTPDATGGVLGSLIDGVAAIFGLLGAIPGVDGFTKIDGDGYQSSNVALDLAFRYPSSPFVTPPTSAGGGVDTIAVTVTAQAAVLSDNWGAASTEDAETQVLGLVLPELLDGTIGNSLQLVAGGLAFPFGYPLLGTRNGEFAVPNRFPPGNGYDFYLDFGYTNFEPLPPGAFEGDNREVICDNTGSDDDPRVCGFREAP